jgi:hypothetical protein
MQRENMLGRINRNALKLHLGGPFVDDDNNSTLAQDAVGPSTPTVTNYLTKLARLGGYLARAGDPPPGNTVIWRGLSRLRDIEIGAKIVEGYG